MPAGHSRPNGQLLESLCTKPNADRMGTLPVAHRSSHVLDRLARCESVEGAICRALAQRSATVRISHIRSIRPITFTAVEITS